MLVRIEARNAMGDLLTLELDDISDGLILADVGGLDPVKATIVSTSFAQQNGKQYHSSRREERNITMTIEFQPDYISTSVEDLRNRIYDYFMTQTEVKLRMILSGGLEVDISGRVETCEAPLFAKEPKADISILCFDPDFVDLEPVVFESETTESTTEETITYVGNVSTGTVLTLNVDRTLTEFSVYHQPPDGTLRTMNFAYSMVAGDILMISSIPGNKFATLTRSGTTTSVLNGVNPSSAYMELMKGDNQIRVYAEGDEIPYTITYNNRYGGL